MTSPARQGRPAIAASQRRRHRVSFWLTDAEHALLILRADLAGVQRHDLARSLSLYGAIAVSRVPRINYEAVAQLVRLGVLLNQAVVLSRRAGAFTDDLRASLLDLKNFLMHMHEALTTAPPESPVDR
jgi:hypothetical protein